LPATFATVSFPMALAQFLSSIKWFAVAALNASAIEAALELPYEIAGVTLACAVATPLMLPPSRIEKSFSLSAVVKLAK